MERCRRQCWKKSLLDRKGEEGRETPARKSNEVYDGKEECRDEVGPERWGGKGNDLRFYRGWGRCEGPARRKGEGSGVDRRDSISQGRVEETQRNGAGRDGGATGVFSLVREVKGGEFGAVDRASNSKGLLTRARSEAGRGPACTSSGDKREREREERREGRGRGRGRREAQREEEGNYYTQPPTPPEFRDSGAQTRLCSTQQRFIQPAFRVEKRERNEKIARVI